MPTTIRQGMMELTHFCVWVMVGLYVNGLLIFGALNIVLIDSNSYTCIQLIFVTHALAIGLSHRFHQCVHLTTAACLPEN